MHTFQMGTKFGKYLNLDLDPHPDWRIQNKSTLICKRKHGCKKYFLQSFLIWAITSSYELTKEGFDIHWIRIRHHITANESAKMLENPGKSVLIRMIFVWTKKKLESAVTNSRIYYFTRIHDPSPSILVNANAISVRHHFDVETVNVANSNRVIAPPLHARPGGVVYQHSMLNYFSEWM